MRQTRRFWLVVVVLVAAQFGPVLARGADDEAGPQFFERKIRPLLVEHCYACHGPGQRKGGLSLVSRAALLAGGDSGPVVHLDDPQRGTLVTAVEYAGDIQMPPSGRLADHEIAALKQWVAAGLPWPERAAAGGTGIRSDGTITAADRQFWSFRPFVGQALPAVRASDWPLVRSDVFLLSRLESESLAPASTADRRTLLRRAAFDLTGLPPGADELDDLLGYDGPDAIHRAVDRLLASPRYGERWARHWLDLARYGEDQAHTFQARMYPQGYRYRDWVAAALNGDLPYDAFVIQQIAGDQAEGKELSAGERIARAPGLGFFALGPVYYADAGCAPKAQADEWDDRVDTLGRGLLGLTLACARCHDHKFDPITMRDYYALAGVFASSKYEEIPLVAPDVVERYNQAVARSKSQDGHVAAAETAQARALADSFVPQLDRYLVAAWMLHNRRKADAKYPVAKVAESQGVREVLLENWRKYVGSDNVQQRAPLAAYDQLVNSQDAQLDLSGDAASLQAVTAVAQRLQAEVDQALAQRKQLEAEYADRLAATPPDQRGSIAKPQLPKPAVDLLQQLLYDSKAPLFLAKDRLEPFLDAAAAAELKRLRDEAAEAKQAIGEKYPIAHGLADGQPTNLKIHLRGNHKTLGDEVPRRFLEVLSSTEPPPFGTGSGRRELARFIASPDNPLTARVIVNRVWQQHFGRGIVDTPSNFGTLGSPPTHPELLDDLTVRFVSAGWSLKWLQREMVLSAAYQQSSDVTADGLQRDPENRLVGRFARRRLDVEAWRDALLAVTGQLDLRIGGPSLNLNDARHNRRTLYSAVSRHELNGMLRLFDFPDPNLTSERRVITTVPMQQLFVLNSDFMVRQARELAARGEAEWAGAAQPASPETFVATLYQRALQRNPSEAELRIAGEFLRQAVDDPSAKLTPREQLAQMILATNEFLFVD